MTPAAGSMMAAAHAGMGEAAAIVAAIFGLGIALYWWSRPRR